MTTRPWKHPKTGIYYVRRAVPPDLRALIGKREEKVKRWTGKSRRSWPDSTDRQPPELREQALRC